MMKRYLIIGLLLTLSFTCLFAQNKVIKNSISAKDSLLFQVENLYDPSGSTCMEVKNKSGSSMYCIDALGYAWIDGRKVANLLDQDDYNALLVKMAADSTLLRSLINGAFVNKVYEKEISSDAELVFTLPFIISSNAVVTFNDAYVKKSLWTGVGTNTLTINLATKQFDFLMINNN